MIPNGDTDYPVYVASGPAKSRTEVKAELAQARADGLVPQNDVDYPIVASQGPSTSRAVVKQELARARAAGELNVTQGS